MALWKQMIHIKAGNIMIVDKPDIKQFFILASAPEDAVVYLFEDNVALQKWINKKSRTAPSKEDLERISQPPAGIDIIKHPTSTIALGQEIKSNLELKAEIDRQVKLDLEKERKERRKKIMEEGKNDRKK